MKQRVILRSRGEFRTEVEAGAHSFVMDEPASAGGSDLGPTPYDLLAAALGGCTAMTLHFYAKREKIPLEGVDVAVSHDRQHAKDCADCTSKEGFIHNLRVEIVLHGDDLSDEQRARLLVIAGKCPVAKTLHAEIRVEDVLVDAV